MSQNKTYLGPLLVLSGAVLWGTTGTTQALAPDGATPLAIGAMRLLVGGLCLLAIAYFLFSKGLSLVPAATAVTLTLAEPLTAATLGVTVLGERLTAPAFAGIGLLLLGILILSISGKKD
ncbi:MAG: EamA family transporter [Desulfotomaculaceae bacterium]